MLAFVMRPLPLCGRKAISQECCAVLSVCPRLLLSELHTQLAQMATYVCCSKCQNSELMYEANDVRHRSGAEHGETFGAAVPV